MCNIFLKVLNLGLARRESSWGSSLSCSFHARARARASVQATDAALTINENADPTVRSDMEGALQRIASAVAHRPNGEAAALTSLVGVSLDLPLHGGKLALGTWQARVLVCVYVCMCDVELARRSTGSKHLRGIAPAFLSAHHRGYTSRTSPAPPPPLGASWWSQSRCGVPRRPLCACGAWVAWNASPHSTSFLRWRVCGRRKRRR
jgi:hypothetical protein